MIIIESKILVKIDIGVRKGVGAHHDIELQRCRRMLKNIEVMGNVERLIDWMVNFVDGAFFATKALASDMFIMGISFCGGGFS